MLFQFGAHIVYLENASHNLKLLNLFFVLVSSPELCYGPKDGLIKKNAGVCSHGESSAVPAEDGPMQSRDPVPGPEVQVSSSTAENFNQLAALLQLHGQSQRTL